MTALVKSFKIKLFCRVGALIVGEDTVYAFICCVLRVKPWYKACQPTIAGGLYRGSI